MWISWQSTSNMNFIIMYKKLVLTSYNKPIWILSHLLPRNLWVYWINKNSNFMDGQLLNPCNINSAVEFLQNSFSSQFSSCIPPILSMMAYFRSSWSFSWRRKCFWNLQQTWNWGYQIPMEIEEFSLLEHESEDKV